MMFTYILLAVLTFSSVAIDSSVDSSVDSSSVDSFSVTSLVGSLVAFAAVSGLGFGGGAGLFGKTKLIL